MTSPILYLQEIIRAKIPFVMMTWVTCLVLTYACDSDPENMDMSLSGMETVDLSSSDLEIEGGDQPDQEVTSGVTIEDMELPDMELPDMEILPPACSNGLDDDEDGHTDFPRDIGCSSREDDDESNPDRFECEDEIDNDEDGYIDQEDPGCGSPQDPTEASSCGAHEAIDISYLSQIVVDTEGQPSIFEACRSNNAPEQVFLFTLRRPVEYLYISTEGSSFDTLLSVRRECISEESEVACNDDVSGAGGPRTSAVQLDQPALGEYYVIVDGFGESAGRVVLNVEAGVSEGEACPPDDGPLVCPRGQACDASGVCAPAACADLEDNDGDERADYPSDPGCESPEDQDETDPEELPECGDGADNDRDGLIDFPNDPECDSSADQREARSPACDDRSDNDGDGLVDYPNDPGCRDANDTNEYNPPACDDGEDNDEDGRTDYPDDPGCVNEDDESERTPQNLPECSDGIDNDGDGATDYPSDALSCRAASDPTEDDPCARRSFRDVTGLTSARGTHSGELNDFGGNCGGGEDAESLLVWRVSADRPLARLNMTTRNSEALVALYARNQCEETEEIGCTFNTTQPLVIGPRAAGEDVYIFVDSRFLSGIWRVQFDAALAEGARCDSEGLPGERWLCDTGLACLEEASGLSRCVRPQCSDQQDNDGDGNTDFPYDPGCTSTIDNSELNPDPLPACSNNIDEDRDGLFDFGEDPDCDSAADDFEGPQCRDGIDNDGDGRIDFAPGGDSACRCLDDPTEDLIEAACSDGCDNDGDGLIDDEDPGCDAPSDNNEFNEPACRDLRDNDGDGHIDYPNDPGCLSSADEDETSPDPLPACADEIDNDGDGLIDFGLDDGCESASDETEASICDLPPLTLDANGQASGNTSTLSGSQVGSCGFGNAPEAIYFLEVAHPANLTVSTSGSQFNTVLYVRSACSSLSVCPADDPTCIVTSTELACSQDAPGVLWSEVRLSAVSGPLYLFVDGFGTQAGAYQLSLIGQYLAGGECASSGPSFITCPQDTECRIDPNDLGNVERCLPLP